MHNKYISQCYIVLYRHESEQILLIHCKVLGRPSRFILLTHDATQRCNNNPNIQIYPLESKHYSAKSGNNTVLTQTKKHQLISQLMKKEWQMITFWSPSIFIIFIRCILFQFPWQTGMEPTTSWLRELAWCFSFLSRRSPYLSRKNTWIKRRTQKLTTYKCDYLKPNQHKARNKEVSLAVSVAT